jgi:4'-phosphopantetheinyl transferase
MASADLVQVVTVRSSSTIPPIADLFDLLDGSEKRRGHQLGSPDRQASFVTARAAVRLVLGRRLGIAPTDVPIVEGPNGKPVLTVSPPYFNLSHTEGLIAVAVRDAGPIGIDVEAARRRTPQPGVLRRTLTKTEQRALNALSPAAARSAFLRAWCRKEAYAKGLSAGLGLDFGRIQVGWGDAVMVGDPLWEVRSLILPPPHVGAVAARGRGWLVKAEAHYW